MRAPILPAPRDASGGRRRRHHPAPSTHPSRRPFAAPHAAARRLEMLTLDEAYDLLRLLQLIVAEGLDELSEEAEWFAREIAARIPSEN